MKRESLADPPCGYGASQEHQDGIQLEGPHFDHESRVDYRDRNELVMSDLDAREALEDRNELMLSDKRERSPRGEE